MSGTWTRNFKADIDTDKYAVFGYRLVNNDYYGEDGMSDVRSSLPLDEYMLDIYNWGRDHMGRQMAGSVYSTIRYTKHYKSKEEANRDWLKIKKEQPNWIGLRKMGFTEF